MPRRLILRLTLTLAFVAVNPLLGTTTVERLK